MKKLFATVAAIALGLGGALVVATPAQAHTPKITASCDGVVFSATNYEADKKNVWAITLNGVYQEGTFGKEFHQTFPVAQNGQVTTGKAQITAVDQKPEYTLGIEINVGPCGEKPEPEPTVVTPAIPEWVDECGPDNGKWVYTDTTEYTYAVTTTAVGESKIKVTPTAGFVFPAGFDDDHYRVQDNTVCPLPPVVDIPVDEPVVEATPEKTLAHTGPSDVTPVVGFIGLGALLLGAGLMVLRRLKKV